MFLVKSQIAARDDAKKDLLEELHDGAKIIQITDLNDCADSAD